MSPTFIDRRTWLNHFLINVSALLICSSDCSAQSDRKGQNTEQGSDIVYKNPPFKQHLRLASRNKFSIIQGNVDNNNNNKADKSAESTSSSTKKFSSSALNRYINKPDSAYTWKFVRTNVEPRFKIHTIKLTSQKWKGINWRHSMLVVEPKEMGYPDAMLLFLSKGTVGDKQAESDLESAARDLATNCRARVAVLRQVPNEPLLNGKFEDNLIAESFVRYLKTKDDEWPLLFPMVKSAVRAMDTMQAFGSKNGKPVNRFVLTGGSKRGWATWLTASVDDRVKAIAPGVIPNLGFAAQFRHQLKTLGAYPKEISPYTSRGLLKLDTPSQNDLWSMVDPLTRRDILTLPKLQINGTNDPYWTLDSMNLYWNQLKGPSWVVYLPNVGHHFNKSQVFYASSSIAALFRHAIGGQPLPSLTWRHDDSDSGAMRLSITSNPPPKSAQLWTTRSNSREFHNSKWVKTSIAPGLNMVNEVACPAKGNIALFADLEYEIDNLRYHLSTQIREKDRQVDRKRHL